MPSSAFQLKGLREKRAAIKAELEKLGRTLRAENRGFRSDEREAFEKLKADWVELGNQVKTVESDMQALDAVLAGDDSDDADGGSGDGGGGNPDDATQNSLRIPGRQNRDYRPGSDGASLAAGLRIRKLAFQAWARAQHGLRLSNAHLDACHRTGLNPRVKTFRFKLGPRPHYRDMGVGSGSAGGDIVAPEFSQQLEKFLKDFSNIRGVCDEFRTDTGVNMPYPTTDDTSNVGEQISENTTVSYQDVSFGLVTFAAYKFGSKAMLVSNELLNDSYFNLDVILGEMAGERIGRIQGQKFTTGSGTGEPQGIVTAAGLGITTASATAIAATELISLPFQVNRAYRNSDSFGYMMHDQVLAYVCTLTDTLGRPLFNQTFNQNDYLKGITGRINGLPVWTNAFMASAVQATNVTALVGDFSKFKIRDVGDVRIRRLDERYADKDQVGFLAFLRSDSRATNANAIKSLTQHA